MIVTRLSTTDQAAEASESVLRVNDGRTIDVNIGGETEKVRLFGVDTPESVIPRKPVESFGKGGLRVHEETR